MHSRASWLSGHCRGSGTSTPPCYSQQARSPREYRESGLLDGRIDSSGHSNGPSSQFRHSRALATGTVTPFENKTCLKTQRLSWVLMPPANPHPASWGTPGHTWAHWGTARHTSHSLQCTGTTSSRFLGHTRAHLGHTGQSLWCTGTTALWALSTVAGQGAPAVGR